MDYKKIAKKIFSIENKESRNNKWYKVVTILGIKFSFRNKDIILNFTKTNSNRFTPKTTLDLVEFHIVEHCNLKCKSCVHFSPLAKEEFLDLKIFEKDIKQMAKLSKANINRINIFGGEPLLNPNVLQYLQIARKNFKNSQIALVTNAILLPKQNDNFWKTLNANNITISITKYPINLPYEEIFLIAKKNSVKIEFFSADKKNNQWHFPLDLEGKQSKIYNFSVCQEANKCTNIYKGKLYICPIASNIHHFANHFNKNIKLTENDYIDIYKTDDIEDILLFISKPSPFCKYCNIKARTFNNEWAISKKDISEWT